MYEELKNCFERFNQKETFKPGDIVQWKPGLKNKRSEGPFIVVEVLTEPVYDAGHSGGSPYFREPLSVVVGIIDSDGDFICVHVDSRRLTKAD